MRITEYCKEYFKKFYKEKEMYAVGCSPKDVVRTINRECGNGSEYVGIAIDSDKDCIAIFFESVKE